MITRMFFDRVYTSFLSSAHAADLRVMLRSPFSTEVPCRADQCRTRTRCAQLFRLSASHDGLQGALLAAAPCFVSARP